MRKLLPLQVSLILVLTPACVSPTTEEFRRLRSSGPGAIPHASASASPTPTPLPSPPLGFDVKVGTAEYATTLLSNGKLFSIGGGRLAGIGPNLVGIPPAPLLVPANVHFVDVQGGLHQSMALDTDGFVWTWGNETGLGLQGSGGDFDNYTPYKILVDAYNVPFNGIVQISASSEYNVALKNDGTVYIWGALEGGVAGNGTTSGVVSRPTKLPFPSGVRIKKVLTSNIVLALATDLSVWSVGGGGRMEDLGTGNSDYTHVHSLPNLPPNIKDIATGRGFSYALTSDGELYGWGILGDLLGLGNGTGAWRPIATPVKLTEALNLPDKVESVICNDHTTHVILKNDRSVWGWGDNVMGEVGNGSELDFSVTSSPYAWDWSTSLVVYHPVRIASFAGRIKTLFTNASFVFYVYMLAEDGKLYSWGRNKTGNLGNGIIPAAPSQGGIAASFPNSWDVTTPTQVNPLGLTAATQKTSPYCLTHPTTPPCDQYRP